MEKNPDNRAEADLARSRAGDPFVGLILDDNWQIKALLGVGAMSRVYRAKHIASRKPAIVKVLHNRIATDPVSISKFHAACHHVMKIGMPSFARMADVQLDGDGRIFLIMEFLRGDSLRDNLFRSGPFEMDLAIDIFTKISQALERLHARRVVHGDLKSSNIFLTRAEDDSIEIHLVDSVVVQLVGGSQRNLIEHSNHVDLENSIDAKYLSPEQLAGQPATVLDDIYSFGSVMYESLTKSMSPSERVFEPANMIADASFSDVDADVAEAKVHGLLTVMAKCLAKNPDDRYQTSSELTEELEALTRKSGSSRPGGRGWKLGEADRSESRKNRDARPATERVPLAKSDEELGRLHGGSDLAKNKKQQSKRGAWPSPDLK